MMRLRAEERVDDVMWLRAVDKDIDAAKLVRVSVSESTTGRGSKTKTSFVCTGTLHKGKDDRMGEYVRAQKKVNTDPRCDGGLRLELQRFMMANFRKQKRQREADNLVDSEEEDDEGAHLSLLLHSYAAPTFLSHTQPCAHSHRCFSRVPCLKLLRRPRRPRRCRTRSISCSASTTPSSSSPGRSRASARR